MIYDFMFSTLNELNSHFRQNITPKKKKDSVIKRHCGRDFSPCFGWLSTSETLEQLLPCDPIEPCDTSPKRLGASVG